MSGFFFFFSAFFFGTGPSRAGLKDNQSGGALEPFKAERFYKGETDPYSILNISPDASLEEAKKAYQRLRSRQHPDRNPSPEAAASFHLINQAYRAVIEQAHGLKEGEEAEILHRTIQAALFAVANGANLREEDRNLRETLEILLVDPKIRKFVNTVMSESSILYQPPLYRKRGTPLQMALYLPESAELLLAHGASPALSRPDLLPPSKQVLTHRTDFLPIRRWPQRNIEVQLPVLKRLLRHGAIDLNGLSPEGETVLERIMLTANSLKLSSPGAGLAKGWTDLFFQLAKREGALNLTNSKGQTVLDRALTYRNREISLHLIHRFGTLIDWDYRNREGRTYLDLACQTGDEEAALSIIKTAGADMAYRSPEGMSYLETAVQADFRRLSDFIARKGGLGALDQGERARVISLAAEKRNRSLLKTIHSLTGPGRRLIAGKVHKRKTEPGDDSASGGIYSKADADSDKDFLKQFDKSADADPETSSRAFPHLGMAGTVAFIAGGSLAGLIFGWSDHGLFSRDPQVIDVLTDAFFRRSSVFHPRFRALY